MNSERLSSLSSIIGSMKENISSSILSTRLVACQNIVQFFACNEFDGFDDRRVFSGRGELVFVEFLNEFTAAILNSLPDFLKVAPLDLDGHEAINQGKGVVKIGAEDGSHKEPRLQRL